MKKDRKYEVVEIEMEIELYWQCRAYHVSAHTEGKLRNGMILEVMNSKGDRILEAMHPRGDKNREEREDGGRIPEGKWELRMGDSLMQDGGSGPH